MRVRDSKIGCMVNIPARKIDGCKQKLLLKAEIASATIENTQFHPAFQDISKSITEDFLEGT